MAETTAEWRANEFMGALLVPALALHRRLLAMRGRNGSPRKGQGASGIPPGRSFPRDNDPEALAGVTDVLAQEFGVSPRFISVRLGQYKLIGRRSSLGGA